MANITRSTFVNGLLGTTVLAWGAGLGYTVLRYLDPPPNTGDVTASVKAGPANSLAPNSGEIIKFGRTPVILIRTPKGELHAFSAVCTHLGCIVQYRPDIKEIWCACHGGHYNLNGINVGGPPPRPLTPYDVHVQNDTIVVSKKA